MANIQVNKMTAADPGVGFILGLNGYTLTENPPVYRENIDKNLDLHIAFEVHVPIVGSNMYYKFNCDLRLPNPLPDSIITEEMVCVIPFPCGDYNADTLKFHLEVQQHPSSSNAVPIGTYTNNNLDAQADKVFGFSTLDKGAEYQLKDFIPGNCACAVETSAQITMKRGTRI